MFIHLTSILKMTFYKSNRVNISVKVVLEPNLLNSRREVHLNNSPTNLWTIQLDNFINVLYLTLIKSFSLQTQLRHALEGFNNTKQIKKKNDSNEYQLRKTNYWYYFLHKESKGVKVFSCALRLACLNCHDSIICVKNVSCFCQFLHLDSTWYMYVLWPCWWSI